MRHSCLAAGLTAAILALCAGDARAASACTTDEFDGGALDGTRWSVLRPAGGVAVNGGRLHVALRPGALDGTVATARDVVLQDTPDAGWTATTRLATGGVDAPGERAGLVLWRGEGDGDNAFATAAFTRTAAGAPRFELRVTDRSVLAAAGDADAPAGGDVLVRVRFDGAELRAAYSSDEGASWAPIGAPVALHGPVRVGLVAVGDAGSAAFDRFTLSCGPRVELTKSGPERALAPLEIGVRVGLADDRDDELAIGLEWDFGDGSGGGGGQNRFHKYATAGTYRPTVWATDSDGNVTRASASVTALASATPCPADSDEFAGNGLDPAWRTLRPVPAGLAVQGGSLWLRPYAGDPDSARNVVVRPAPAGPWTLTTAVDVAALDAVGDRAGLALVRGDAAVHVGVQRTGDDAIAVVGGDGGVAVPPGPVPDRVHLAVTSDGALPATHAVRYSLDGSTWATAGGAFAVGGNGQLQVGLAALGSSVSGPAGFEHARFEGPQPCGAPDTLPPATTHELVTDPDGAVRVRLAAVDDVIGAGVERTEHRIGDAPFAPYAGPFVIAAPGTHDVAYRSIDRAGNVEPARHVRVEVPAPPGDGPQDRGGAPLPAVPRGIGDGPPAARAAARILAPRRARLSTRALVRAGLRVRAACSGATSARVRLAVSRRVARRLGLGRRTTLALRSGPCDGRVQVRLVVDRRVRRALRGGPRRFAATLEVRAGRTAADRRKVRFA